MGAVRHDPHFASVPDGRIGNLYGSTRTRSGPRTARLAWSWRGVDAAKTSNQFSFVFYSHSLDYGLTL